ncbi:MAG: hypothetical protein KGH66_03945 [Candidatus Micrarchaeota archaeon]|nr:hypothetical protein [Candidatus Micrarchaeota archaeon]
MENLTLAAELYIRTVLRNEVRPAVDALAKKVDAAIEAVGSHKKTTAFGFMCLDLLVSAAWNHGAHHDPAATVIPLAALALPSYLMQYYGLKGQMSIYHRLKGHLRKDKAPSNDAVGSFYFRA